MTIVTGDRYLDLLSRFLESNTGSLLDGGLLLKLNPLGLHYLQTRLEALQELEALRVGAPVDYFRAYVADLGDHRALEQLRRVLSLLNSVKVVSLIPGPSRDPTTITLLPFSRLRSLELRGCDLSTTAARGLLELRPILEKLVCYNSADALRHIFAEPTKEVQDAQGWSRLVHVSCLGNGMLLMDESLQLLPVVEVLDLSRNRFAKLANLHKCSKLKILDVGFNHITSLGSVNQNLRSITKLILKNNALVSTRGLHRLVFLEALDLSYNLLSNFREVEMLSELPSIQCLWLEGNPLTFSRLYRKEALSFFEDPKKLILDGEQASRGERCVARKIAARRLKQRSKYGAFIPAQSSESCALSLQLSDTGEIDDNSNKEPLMRNEGLSSSSSVLRARKKNSRLARIQDVTLGLKMASRALELQRSGSISNQASPDANSSLPVVVESKEEMEETVLDLMKQAEDLKRAGSDCWLKDLNVLLEKEAKFQSQLSGPVERSTNDTGEQSHLWQRRRRKRITSSSSVPIPISRDSEISSYKSDEHDETEETESSERRLSTDLLARFRSGFVGNENYLRGSSSSTTPSVDESMRVSLVEGEQPPILPEHPSYIGDSNSHGDIGTFRLAEEFVTGKMSASSASSPPQFNQDLLQRRQNLERELLQLPPEPDFSPFYDSESSSGTINSDFSDSSESPQHSSVGELQRFRFEHNFGDAEVPSVNSSSGMAFLNSHEGDTAHSNLLENARVGRSNTCPDIDIGDKNVPEVEAGESVSNNEQKRVQVGVEDALHLKGAVSDMPRPKSKPCRRIVNLDLIRVPSLGDGNGGSESPSLGEIPDSNTSTTMQRTMSLGRSESGLGLRRSRKSSGRLSCPFNTMGSTKDLLTSVSLHKGETNEGADGSLQFHKVPHAVGQCA